MFLGPVMAVALAASVVVTAKVALAAFAVVLAAVVACGSTSGMAAELGTP
jgi:hypothetical protein